MINFLERVLRMPRAVLTVMALLLGAGLAAYIALPKESFPAIDIPYLYVSVNQTGVSPQDAERLLAKPLEDELKDLDNLENITSTSSTGHTSVLLEFNINSSKDEALSDVRAAVDRAKSKLPGEADDPTITEVDITGVATIQVAVYGDVPERTLVQRAKDLQDRLKEIPDVRDVTISGSRDEVLEVQVDQQKLETYNLTAAQLLDALSKNNMVVPGGTLNTGQGSFNLEVPGLLTNAADVYSLPVKTDGNTVVTFGDVASVVRTFKDATEYSHVNGAPAITLGVSKKAGTNVIEVSDQVRAITAEFTKAWPAEVRHSFILDQSESTKNLFRTLEAAVLTAVALVMITCVATLGVRPAIMIGTSIPISFMIAFLVVQLMGMSINMMIMFGLVLAVGVLVDDPIVVVEYAERKLAEGMSRREAFIEAAKKMFVPVVGATATTLGAFVPLLFWPGIIGKFMSYLPIVVIVVMCASLLSALVFMPIIGALIARAHIDPKEKEAADIVMYADKFDPKKIKGFTGNYVRTLSHLVKHPVMTLTVGFGIIVGIFMWYGAHPTGMEAFPASEAEYGTVAVIGIGNYSPNEVRDLLANVEQRIISVPGIQEVVMKFGGNLEGGGTLPPNTIGNFQLQLMPYAERVKAEVIFQNIRDKVKDIPGLDIQIMAQENGPPAGKAINLRVESNTYADLAPVVGKLRDYIEHDLGNTVDIEDGRPAPGIDWQITIDRVEAAKYGIGVRELSPYVQLVTDGVKIGTYRPDDATDELDIRARLPEAERSFAALDSMRIATTQGLVPVSNFLIRKAVPKVANIVRRNGVYVMNVGANLTAGVATAEKVKELQAWTATQTFPSDVKIVYGGAEEQTNETNAFIMKAMAGALSLICFVLLLEYNSFYQVAVTLTTIAMSLAGVLLGMSITGMSFSAIMTGIGIVALAGIVVKNSIVLIDTYNHYARGEGVEPTKAMLITAAQRVRPVLLTATVTALGVIPMALNIEFDFIRREIVVGGLAGSWFVHLSAALVSGLLFSTMLTLIMVPVMITAPSVLWAGVVGRVLRWIGSIIVAAYRSVVPRREQHAATPEGFVVDVPVTANSASKYIKSDGTGLVEKESNGVTIVSRQDAAE